jgi:hypothetical protein
MPLILGAYFHFRIFLNKISQSEQWVTHSLSEPNQGNERDAFNLRLDIAFRLYYICTL